MVGQKDILANVDYCIETGTFPRFMIISGQRGCGKTTLAHEICRRMRAYMVECELSVEAVREAVKNCYKCAGTTVYLFKDADKMSAAAKNSMLKITEEPPRQAHFIVTVSNSMNMLETLRSRATNVCMSPYSREELREFYGSDKDDEDPTLVDISDTPGQLKELSKMNYQELLTFCETVVDNVQKVTGVNAFKIVQKVRTKDDGDGYDPYLFFHCMEWVLKQRVIECLEVDDQSSIKMYFNMLLATSECKQEFILTGVKKDATLDMWVLKMREA